MRAGEVLDFELKEVKEEATQGEAALLRVRRAGEVSSLRRAKVKDEEADVQAGAGLLSDNDGCDCDDERLLM
jgi:hypothetical protein